MKEVYLLNAKRTAIGKFLGSFYENDARNISSQVIRDLIKDIDPEDIDMTIVGNVISANMGQSFFRKIAIDAGIPIEKPAYGVNMVCGSGMLAIVNAIKEVELGADLVVAGGVEFMSNIPYATDTYLRLGKKFGNFNMTDLMVSDGLTDAFSGVHMGVTAENIAKKYNISRKKQDEYSWDSLNRAIKAVDEGKFKEEIVPVTVKDYKNREFVFDTDEFPNRTSSPEKIASLKPIFIKDGSGTITAANSSGINDGACFTLICSKEYLEKHNIVPLARLSAYSMVGLDPQYMGLGPYYAIRKLLNDNNLKLDDIDVLEINEAFAAQVLGCVKLLAEEYGCKEDDLINKLNINGSGLGLGHPLGCSGARITTTLAYLMKNNDHKRGIASLCVGGGQGIALMLER